MNFFKIIRFCNGLMLLSLYLMIVSAFLFYFLSPAFAFTGLIILVIVVFSNAGHHRTAGNLYEGLSLIGAREMQDASIDLLTRIGDADGKRYSVEHAKITMSYIRGESVLDTGKAVYNIPIIENQSIAARVNEQRIALQDIFVAWQISVTIGIGTSTDSAAVLYTYPNVTAFSTSGAAAALYSIYNGRLILLNNNTQVVPAFDIDRSLYAPMIQSLAAQFYASSPTQRDPVDFSQNTYYNIAPGWVINGAGKMQLTVNCGSAPAAIQTNSFVCVKMRGNLFQNVTPVN